VPEEKGFEARAGAARTDPGPRASERGTAASTTCSKVVTAPYHGGALATCDRSRPRPRGAVATVDVSARPLRDRRARLEDVVAGSELVILVRRLVPDGQEAWKQVVERGYEGVAKDEASVYKAGPRGGG
jgi:hypothetical protein